MVSQAAVWRVAAAACAVGALIAGAGTAGAATHRPRPPKAASWAPTGPVR